MGFLKHVSCLKFCNILKKLTEQGSWRVRQSLTNKPYSSLRTVKVMLWWRWVGFLIRAVSVRHLRGAVDSFSFSEVSPMEKGIKLEKKCFSSNKREQRFPLQWIRVKHLYESTSVSSLHFPASTLVERSDSEAEIYVHIKLTFNFSSSLLKVKRLFNVQTLVLTKQILSFSVM